MTTSKDVGLFVARVGIFAFYSWLANYFVVSKVWPEIAVVCMLPFNLFMIGWIYAFIQAVLEEWTRINHAVSYSAKL